MDGYLIFEENFISMFHEICTKLKSFVFSLVVFESLNTDGRQGSKQTDK